MNEHETVAKLATPTESQMFALMDDAAQRMNEAAAAVANGCFTQEERDALVKTFEQRNATLARQIAHMDAQQEAWEARVRVAQKEIDDLSADYKRTAHERWAKHNKLTQWTTWFTWIMFWVSGFLARGAVQRWWP